MNNTNDESGWEVGDVFTTTFWGEPEVCLILLRVNAHTYFVRLESIRRFETLKKDYCAAGLEDYVFDRIQKTFIHHSQWYYEYRHLEPQTKNS